MQTKNQLGFNILSKEFLTKIMGEVPDVEEHYKEVIIDQMASMGIKFPINDSNNTPEFNVSPLIGNNIAEHFSNISKQLTADFLQDLLDFTEAQVNHPDLISLEKDDIEFDNNNIRMEKYKGLKVGWNRIEKVFLPVGLTNITHVEYPLERTLVFDCETFVKGSNMGHPIIGTACSDKAYYIWLHPALCSDIAYEPTYIPIGQNKILIAHKASFDHMRVSESYFVGDNNIWIDTLSMHVNVSGYASGQRLFSTTNFSPPWADYGCPNDLVSTYNFHVKPLVKLTKDAKTIRNTFVDADHISEIRKDLHNLIQYAIKDVYYTFKLFSDLFPKYHQANPSLTTLYGHVSLLKSFLPLHDDWDNWFKNCEQLWFEAIEKQSKILSDLVLYTLDCFNEDWTIAEVDPWLSQLDWTIESKLRKNGKPSSKWYGYPQWLREGKIASIVDEKLVINKLTTKQRICPILLRLKWNGAPIFYKESMGFCYYNDNTFKIERIPHPKTQGANVGEILTKDFLEDFEEGRISSDLPQAKELLQLGISIAYWTSVRSRVAEVSYNTFEGFNAHVPDVVPHNTSTNRAGCSLWFTVPGIKPTKIGSETKTMCRAPKGWKFVQSDYDGQESLIASILADTYYKVAGSNPFSHAVLVGSKKDGTDMHTVTAKAGNINRDLAKNINYALQYGSGAKTVANLYCKGDKTLSYEQAIVKANELIQLKKGKKMSSNSKYLHGGTDSFMYNEMLRIASTPNPVNPLSGTKMSTAFRPIIVKEDFFTMRSNWVIKN